jgi:hypothetical protein
MKKQYKTPITESVKVNLYGSILEGIGTETGSIVTNEGLAKEQGDFFGFDDDSFGDIWGDDEDPKDPWKE